MWFPTGYEAPTVLAWFGKVVTHEPVKKNVAGTFLALSVARIFGIASAFAPASNVNATTRWLVGRRVTSTPINEDGKPGDFAGVVGGGGGVGECVEEGTRGVVGGGDVKGVDGTGLDEVPGNEVDVDADDDANGDGELAGVARPPQALTTSTTAARIVIADAVQRDLLRTSHLLCAQRSKHKAETRDRTRGRASPALCV